VGCSIGNSETTTPRSHARRLRSSGEGLGPSLGSRHLTMPWGTGCPSGWLPGGENYARFLDFVKPDRVSSLTSESKEIVRRELKCPRLPVH
jgi:hypothetical protein